MHRINLADIKPDVRMDYSKRIIFDRHDLPEGGHMLQEVTIPPFTKQRSHHHLIQTEIFFILAGEGSIYINGLEYACKPGDALICSPGDKHFNWNKSSKEFSMLVIKINRPKDNEDSIWVE